MTVTSDPQMRRLAARILLWQALVTVALAALAGLADEGALPHADVVAARTSLAIDPEAEASWLR